MKTGSAVNDISQGERTKNPLQSSPANREDSKIDPPAAVVSVQGCQYRVDLGAGSAPRFHTVSKNKECSCGAPNCEAIEAVRQYLLSGGLRAPDPEGMPACPICGSRIFPDRTWDGKYTRTSGWRCEKGGLRHFLEDKAARIKKHLAENPHRVPPALVHPGIRQDQLIPH